MKKPMVDLILNNFWEQSDYSKNEYTGAPVTKTMVQDIERITGYKLPESYIKLLKSQNGGIPLNTRFPTVEPTSWAKDHVAIAGIFGIDKKIRCSILGEHGSEFMKREWGYPEIGLYVCDCPSAGHDMIALDYSCCGEVGEPRVVHVDQELDYNITVLAQDFEEFIEGLVNEENFKDTESWSDHFLWEPKKISYAICKRNPLLSKGLELVVKQKLDKGEEGWLNLRIEVPNSWGSAVMNLENGKIVILINDRRYLLDKNNIGMLSFEILEAGELSDEELEKFWCKFALDT